LATGYLNLPELTAERFAPNPFATAQDREENWNPRLYRTGDSVRWLEDGNLEFLGAWMNSSRYADSSELGEIEAALARHPAVSLTAATIREEPGGEKQVVAWIAPSPARPCRPEDCAASAAVLPPYMVPGRLSSSTVSFDASGKIDRLALSEPPAEPDSVGEEKWRIP